MCAPAGDAEPGSDTNTGTIAQAKQAIKRTAQGAVSTVKSATADTRTRVREETEKVVTEKRETAANKIGGFGSAMHESARSLEEKDPNIAHFAHRAADRLEGIADYVRSRDFNGLRTDAEGLARRNPALFFGGMFLAGLVLGNVVKASRRNSTDDASEWEPETTADWDRTDPSSLPSAQEITPPPAIGI
ncbi:MAG TPA: hypothetical protein VM029_20830 [Opitutaceae bacterium]|nr:hypothetical protein [Opitutaceae bacterium]